MKKGLIFIIALALAGSMSAQMYVGLGAGYGMGANKMAFGTEDAGTKSTLLTGSFGQGININVDLGFFFNDNLGIELGINDFMGSTLTESKDTSSTTEAKASLIRISPRLIYKFDNGLYGKFGMILPVSGKITQTTTGTNYEQVEEYKGAMTIGFTGALGMNFEISDKMDFYAELQYIGLSMKPSTSEITTAKFGGVDALPSMTTSQIQTEYFNELDGTTMANLTANDPSQSFATPIATSSFGVNVGIHIKF